MPERHSKEEMTLETIREDKWASVDLDLPHSASPELLTAARMAAQECAKDARHIIHTHDSEDADSVGEAAEMQFMEGQAEDRIEQINSRLQSSFPQP